MVTTPGIRNLIREGKTEQIEQAVQTGSKYVVRTIDMALADLYKKGEITAESALSYAVDKEVLKRLIMFQTVKFKKKEGDTASFLLYLKK